MKTYWILLICLITLACSNSKSTENDETTESSDQAEVQKTETTPSDTQASVPPAKATDSQIEYELLDSAITKDLKKLHLTYSSVPFYIITEDQKYFVVSNQPYSWSNKHFTKGALYGIVSSRHELQLPVEFDKIYNPGITLTGCMEVEKNGKIGLYNYAMQKLLPVQFDYIFPDKSHNGEMVFGLKDDFWYQVTKDLIVKPAPDFNPAEVIRNLSFSLEEIPDSQMMYNTYRETLSDEIEIGKSVLVIPSYLNQIIPLETTYFDNIVTDDQRNTGGYDVATYSLEMKQTREKSTAEKVKSFFISFFEQGVDAREYIIDSRNVVSYNEGKNRLVTSSLRTAYDPQGPCSRANYDFLNDSIVQVSSARYGRLYSHSESYYEFYKINSDGTHTLLKSDRYFDFTKFALINESYFKGCFTDELETPTTDHNLWQYDHLSIEELDIMRNEIFADYGYKFQTEKWHKYFSGKAWYTPQYDDVNHLLSDIDKENIKTILKVKKAMLGKEEEYRNKTAVLYHAAG